MGGGNHENYNCQRVGIIRTPIELCGRGGGCQVKFIVQQPKSSNPLPKQ